MVILTPNVTACSNLNTKQPLTIHSSEADELADKHEDEQHPAASPEEQPVVPHRFAHQPTAMETLSGAPTLDTKTDSWLKTVPD